MDDGTVGGLWLKRACVGDLPAALKKGVGLVDVCETYTSGARLEMVW